MRAGQQVNCHIHKHQACAQLNIFAHINHPFNLQFIDQNRPSVEPHFHLYGSTNEVLAVQRQSAEICNFYERGIILMRIMGESLL